MIEALNLCKEFVNAKAEPVHAVRNLSFTAESGMIYGLLGANGAGKTTTLRMLSTVIQPTTGTAKVNGHDILTESAAVRGSIGFLSTTTAIYARLKPLEVLEYFGAMYGMSDNALQDRIKFVADRLKLHEFSDRQCDKLSTGQKQRVSIARAILHDPPVVFFDEPTAGLDVINAQTVLEFIEECRESKKTVVFSTHIMTEAERLCDKVGIIHDGELKQEGTVQELMQRSSQTSLEQAFLHYVKYEREFAGK